MLSLTVSAGALREWHASGALFYRIKFYNGINREKKLELSDNLRCDNLGIYRSTA